MSDLDQYAKTIVYLDSERIVTDVLRSTVKSKQDAVDDLSGDIICESSLTITRAKSLVLEDPTQDRLDISTSPMTESYNLVFPETQGTISQVIFNDGSGQLKWKIMDTNIDMDELTTPVIEYHLAYCTL